MLSLRNFSRLDESQKKAVDIHEGIDSTLLILQHRLKAKVNNSSIEIVKHYGNLPLVECYAAQLNQVFMNIISNAIDALEEYNEKRSPEEIKAKPCQIKICTEVIGKAECNIDKKHLSTAAILIKIIDNGPGMSAAVRSQIFNPFFTTKPVGKGTGLGLSISYQIVTEKHHGILECISQPGQGTEFWIQIPIDRS